MPAISSENFVCSWVPARRPSASSPPPSYIRCSIPIYRKNFTPPSKRGPGGGYTLARPAKEISMLEIIEAMEGSLESKMEITQYTKYAPFTANMEMIFKDATTKAKDILHDAKISKMIK